MMEEKRNYLRFPVHLQARCYGLGSQEHKECSIAEISLQGIIITLHLTHSVPEGSTFLFEIDLPGRSEPINSLAKIKWIEHAETPDDSETPGYLVGGKFTMIKDSDKQALLDYAFDDLIRRETES